MQPGSARWLLLAALPLALASPLGHQARGADAQEVNVYSYRQPYLIERLLKKFTEDTDIKVNVIFAEKGLSGVATEGRNSPADLLLSVDGEGSRRRPGGALAGARERNSCSLSRQGRHLVGAHASRG